MNICNKGFTLIEVMIVVAILAILTTIALPTYSRYQEKGRLTMAKAYLNQARQVATEEFHRKGKYPTDKAVYNVSTDLAKYYEIEVSGTELTAKPNANNRFKATAKLDLKTGVFTYPVFTYDSVCKSMERIKD